MDSYDYGSYMYYGSYSLHSVLSSCGTIWIKTKLLTINKTDSKVYDAMLKYEVKIED